jgi:hypothetical protein
MCHNKDASLQVFIMNQFPCSPWLWLVCNLEFLTICHFCLGALLLIGVTDKSIFVAGAFDSNKSKSLEKF